MILFPTMEPEPNLEMEDDLRPEYDLSELLKGAVQGKYAERYRAGTNLVLLAPDVASAFPNDDAVNEALRLVMQLARIQERVRAKEHNAESRNQKDFKPLMNADRREWK